MKRRKAVFLDRDGTLVHDRPGFYLKRPEQLRVYPFSAAALRLLRRAGYRLVVVSNQSGLARGFFDRRTLDAIHRHLRERLRRGGARLDAIYFCPHHPDDGCRCRKPSPVLARRAARELGLRLRGSVVVGDKKADIDMAQALGLPSVLVRTGHGRSQRAAYGRRLRPTHETRNVLTAARWIVNALACWSLCLGAAWAEPGARRKDPVAISTAIAQPYELARGTLPVSSSATLAAVPWFPEYLRYEVKWGIFSVGTSDLHAREILDFNGAPAYHIVSEAKSNSFCDAFYKVRDLNESWIDARELYSLGYLKKLREGSYHRDEWVLYDNGAKRWVSKAVSRQGEESYAAGELPGPVQDILSSMYYIRSKPLKVGDEITLDVNTRKNWPLVIKVTRKARVHVPAGRFDTVEVEPFLRQEGIFIQKGKRLQVWLTDDARHLPVRMSVEVFFGNVTADLIEAKPLPR